MKYRILLYKDKRGDNRKNSLLSFYLKEEKIEDSNTESDKEEVLSSNVIRNEIYLDPLNRMKGKVTDLDLKTCSIIYETDDTEDLKKEISELSKTFAIGDIVPVAMFDASADISIYDNDALSILQFEVNGFVVNVDFNTLEGKNIDFPMLFTDKANRIKLLTDRDCSILFNGSELSTEVEHLFYIDSISATNRIEMEFIQDGVVKKIYVNTLNSSLVNLNVLGEYETNGDYYCSFFNKSQIFKLDSKGKFEFYFCPQDDLNITDFRKHFVGTVEYYSYFVRESNYTGLHFDDFVAGYRVILDSNYNKIDEIRIVQSDNFDKDYPIDVHDFVMIDVGHYICSTFRMVQVSNIPSTNFYTGERILTGETSYVIESCLQEQKDGNSLFDWRSSNYSSLYSMTVHDTDELYNDFDNSSTIYVNYCYINNFCLLNDEVIAASCKNMGTILLINRTYGNIVGMIGDCYNSSSVAVVPDGFNVQDEACFVYQNYTNIRKMENNFYVIEVLHNKKNSGIAIEIFSLDMINKECALMTGDLDSKTFINVNNGSLSVVNSDNSIYCICYGKTANYALNYLFAVVDLLSMSREDFKILIDENIEPFRTYYFPKIST